MPQAGRGHIDIEVCLFQRGAVLVRRPGRPVAGLAEGHAGQDAAGLHVLADDDIEIARGGFAARREMQRGILAHLVEGDELHRIVPVTGAEISAKSQPSAARRTRTVSSRGM